ncbi:MAG: ABC transporter substrate-binding protein [Dehalococcoidia bacterium]|nr:ABC transporter substrate-binding protein [Dehalococcoidia bacterium]
MEAYEKTANYWKRKIRRRSVLGGAATTAIGIAALTLGCGDDDDSGGTTAPSDKTQTQGATPKPGGSLTIHDGGDPASFDYIKTWSFRTILYTGMAYPRLLKFDTGPGIEPLDFKITTDLSPAMPEQPDGTTYVFKIRKAKWENKAPLNGRALTTDDVIQSWKRLAAELPSRQLFTDVAKVEATGDDTVTFKLSKPLGPFINHIGHQGYFYIMPPELFNGDKLQKDIWSAGPFIFTGYQVGAQVTFKKNPDYFIKDRPYLDEVTWKIIPDASTTMAALRTKQVDSLGWAAVVTPNDVSSLKKDMPGATFLKYPVQGNSWFGMDLTDPVFQDKRVRQALSMAINRDDQVKVGGEGVWAMPYGALTQWYFDPKDKAFPNAKYYEYNLKEAKALLSAAGAGKLGPYDLIGSGVWTPTQLQQAQLLQEQIKAVGVETNFKQLAFAEFYAKTVIGGKWSGGLAVSANLVGADPNEYLTTFWEAQSPRLISPGLAPLLDKDAELTSAIEAQKRELDAAKRKDKIKTVVDIMADRMYNIPLTVGNAYHVHQQNVHLDWIFTYANEYLVNASKS